MYHNLMFTDDFKVISNFLGVIFWDLHGSKENQIEGEGGGKQRDAS